MSTLLDRYAALSGDAAAFRDACGRPLPETGWIPLARRRLLDVLPLDGASALPWNDGGFRFPHRSVMFGVQFLTGGLLIQEEAAMAAVSALDPRPGERILDLCAAPGNKTVQLADAVGADGWVVANDVSAARLTILRGLADRFGLTRLTITVHDGASFPEREVCPGQLLQFDRVLVDVPCSCEGTCRSHPRVLSPGNQRKPSLPVLQESLLRKAIRLTRPGGVILYATCTFAPEENEAVVARTLQQPEPGQDVDIEPVHLPGLTLGPGLDAWQGQHWPTDLRRCARIWPQQNDTGGFFLARLRKNGSPEYRMPPWPDRPVAPLNRLDTPWSAYDVDTEWMDQRAELPTDSRRSRVVGLPAPLLPLNVLTEGMTGLNRKGCEPRLSTDLARCAAPVAAAGVAELDPADIIGFLKGERLKPSSLILPKARTRLALVRSGPLGLGLAEVECNGDLQSLFPRHAAGLEVGPWLDSLAR
ncbi:MAG: RsmB/NOP family class I SAM-dependent RNA methyltransferase [Bacteroidetes bacterium]|nr:RsmB/NOP family class I SAM-dependent RNA methyltransferase [Bacteroidota bacterium]